MVVEDSKMLGPTWAGTDRWVVESIDQYLQHCLGGEDAGEDGQFAQARPELAYATELGGVDWPMLPTSIIDTTTYPTTRLSSLFLEPGVYLANHKIAGYGFGLEMEGNANECGICLGEWTNPVKLPCGHSFCANCLSGWKSNYAHDRLCRAKEQQGKRCPICRGTIPPSQEEVANYKMIKSIVEDKSNIHDYDYETYVREVKLFEAEYGDDWEGNVIEYDSDFV
ncbi:hypothetical protein THAOC_28310, partial [Thalassiosira oceanica]